MTGVAGVSVPSPGLAARCGCCRTGPPRVAAGLGPQAGLFVPPWRCGEQSPAVPVPAGTISKHCVGSLHRGQRLALWFQLWVLYTALVLSSATPQPLGESSSWHWLPHPISPNICPQPQQYRGTALCLVLLGRDRSQVGNSSGFNKYILTPVHCHHKLCEKPGQGRVGAANRGQRDFTLCTTWARCLLARRAWRGRAAGAPTSVCPSTAHWNERVGQSWHCSRAEMGCPGWGPGHVHPAVLLCAPRPARAEAIGSGAPPCHPAALHACPAPGSSHCSVAP